MPDLNVNVFRINRTSLKDPLMQFLCFFLSQKKRLQDTCEMELQRPNFTNFDAVFCKKSMFRWIWGKTFFFGTKFSFFGDQGDLFRRLDHISSEVVPISSEVVLIALLYWMFRD